MTYESYQDAYMIHFSWAIRTLAIATFLVWRLRTGACGFWPYRMHPGKSVFLMKISLPEAFDRADQYSRIRYTTH